MNHIDTARPSPIAGSWYPGDLNSLRNDIANYISKAEINILKEKVIGLISPHAGYIYSAETAGYAYRCVEGYSYDLVVVASPMHAYHPYPLLTSAHNAYSTPLGKIEIATEVLDEVNEKMASASLPPYQGIANDREHSLEIQLPFLQFCLAQPFKLIPLMIRTHDLEVLERSARILVEVIKTKKVLLVASTDLSHFYNEDTANRFDEVMIKQMTNFSPAGVLETEFREEGFACGAGAVAFILWAAKELGGQKVTLLKYSTSAQTTGDTSSVVGYGSLAITG